MPRRRITKDELLTENNNLKLTIQKIKANAVKIQIAFCCYGTQHGDGRPCDCKYVRDKQEYIGRHPSSEETGCCEAREIIDEAEKALHG